MAPPILNSLVRLVSVLAAFLLSGCVTRGEPRLNEGNSHAQAETPQTAEFKEPESPPDNLNRTRTPEGTRDYACEVLSEKNQWQARIDRETQAQTFFGPGEYRKLREWKRQVAKRQEKLEKLLKYYRYKTRKDLDLKVCETL